MVLEYNNIIKAFNFNNNTQKERNITAQWDKKTINGVAKELKKYLKDFGSKLDKNKINKLAKEFLNNSHISDFPEFNITLNKNLLEKIEKKREKMNDMSVVKGSEQDFKDILLKSFGIDVNTDSEQVLSNKMNALKEYLKMIGEERIGHILFENGDFSSPCISDDYLMQKLNELNEDYGYFSERDLNSNQFKNIYKVALYSFIAEDKNYKVRDRYIKKIIERSIERAFKIKSLFNDFKHLDSFRKSYMADRKISEFLSVELDENIAPEHLKKYQKLISKIGFKALDNFHRASSIISANNNVVPKDKDEFYTALAKVEYQQYDIDPEFAILCIKHDVKKHIFSRYIELLKDGQLAIDDNGKLITNNSTLPEVFMNFSGDTHSDMEEKQNDSDMEDKYSDEIFDKSPIVPNNLYLVKLPKGDKRALILGDIVNCCQSVGGHSEVCVIDGVNLKNNDFYVLLKSTKKVNNLQDIDWDNLEDTAQIIGQGYCWRSREGGLVFDSWENLTPHKYDKYMPAILENFAQEVIKKDPSITRVAIGGGGKTPEFFFQEDLYNVFAKDSILEGTEYGDANTQSEIFVIENLIREREKFQKLLEKSFPTYTINANILNNGYINKVPITYESGSALFFNIIKKYGLENVILALEPNNIIKTLASNKGIDMLKEGVINFEILFNIDLSKALNLVSNNALQMFKEEIVNFKTLADMDEQSIRLLTSNNAFQMFKEEIVNFKTLADMDEQSIRLLTSNNALQMFKEVIDFEKLANMGKQSIRLLTSNNALQMFKEEIVNFKTLANMNEQSIRLLTSNNALQMFKEGIVDFETLANMNEQSIRLLTSNNALRIYKGGFSFEELLSLGIEKIKLLSSDEIVNVYKDNRVRFKELSQLSFDKIQIIIDNPYPHIDGFISFEELSKYSIKKIEKLLSVHAELLSNYHDFGNIEKSWEDMGNAYELLKKMDEEELIAKTEALGLTEQKVVNLDSILRMDMTSLHNLLTHQSRFVELKKEWNDIDELSAVKKFTDMVLGERSNNMEDEKEIF